MAEMKSYVPVLQQMNEDIQKRIEEAKGREESWSKVIEEVRDKYTSSTAELARIKKSFAFANWFKAKKKKGLSAEEARDEAGRYSNYADVVEQIVEEEQQMLEAKEALSKAVDDITKREFAQQRIAELMDMLGMIE